MPLAITFLAVVAALSLFGLSVAWGMAGFIIWLSSVVGLAVCFVVAIGAIRIGQRPVVELLEEIRRR